MTEKEKGRRKKVKVKTLILTFFLLPLTFCLTVHAAPTTQPANQVRAWFEQLADTSADVRDTAMDRLLSLTREDLPTLQRVVAASRPLKPSQRSALPQIVYHVYKSGIVYENSPAGQGFLGIELGWIEYDVGLMEGRGVMVVNTEQGFPSYRLLRPGDRIRSITEPVGFKFLDHMGFIRVIQMLRAGQEVILEIDREGKIMQIPLELRVRPLAADMPTQLPAWRAQMQEEADNYWKDNFGRLVDEDRTPLTRLPAANARQE